MNVQTDDYDKLYHSNLDTSALVDWDHLARIAKFVFRAAVELDAGLLPYSLEARARDLAGAWKADRVGAAGADPAIVSRVDKALESFGRAAAAFEAGRSAISAGRTAAVNSGLLAVEKALNIALTGLSPADDDLTVYPYQSVIRDLRRIDEALAALAAAPPDMQAALKALGSVYLTRLGIAFSYPVYQKYIARLDPAFARINWGAQGHLPPPLDLVTAYRKIQARDPSGARAELEAVRRTLLSFLKERLETMAEVLGSATSQIQALAGS
jgi:hypothetical protein